MQVNELKTEELEKEFEVIIPATEIDLAVQNKMKDLAMKISLPGFRPGKVPMNVLKNKYENSVFAEIAEERFKFTLGSIIKDRNFDLLNAPEVINFDAKPGQDLKFSFKLELRPNFDLPNFSEITLEKVELSFSDNEIKEMQDVVRKWRAKEVEIEDKKHKSLEGEVVVIDFKGFKDGVAFEGGEAKEFKLELGAKAMIPGFEEQILGKKVGDEFEIKLTFPEQYHSADLAGKEAKFEIKLHKILKKELPEWNEDYAKELNYESLAELNDFVKKLADSKHAESLNLIAKIRLFNKIDEAVNFSLPSKMVEKEFANLMAQLEKEGESTAADSKEDYQKVAKRRVKIGLVLSEYAKAKNITVTENDLHSAIMMQSRQMGFDKAGMDHLIKFYRENQNAVLSLRDSLLESKAVDYILSEEVKMSKVKVSVKELESLLDKEAEEALW
jgi:trigger factor